MSDAPVPLILQGLNDQELQTVAWLLNIVDSHAAPNRLKEAYYDGRARVRNLGIAIPPSLSDVNTVVGWPGTAVDVLGERLNWQKFTSATDQDRLDELVLDNGLTAELPQGITDALISGIAFICVGAGYDDEVDPLITVESPVNMTVRFNRRQRRVDAALSRIWDPERQMTMAFTLWLPDQTIYADRSLMTNDWVVTHRDEHSMDRVLVSRLVNRPRTGNPYGRSEVTPAVMAYTDNAVRTVLGMDIAREFYAAPQRWALGVDEKGFTDAAGNPIPAWESYIGRFLSLGMATNDQGEMVKPEVGQFTAAPMTPYGDQLRTLAQLLSSEVGMPPSYLGFVTENPASADAIRASAARLESRAERCIVNFDPAIVNAVQDAMLIQDLRDGGSAPESRPAVGSVWRDPGTPTKTAAAASAQALITAGVLRARSPITYRYLDLPPETIAALEAEDAEVNASPVQRLLDVLANGGGEAPGQPQLAPGQPAGVPAGPPQMPAPQPAQPAPMA